MIWLNYSRFEINGKPTEEIEQLKRVGGTLECLWAIGILLSYITPYSRLDPTATCDGGLETDSHDGFGMAPHVSSHGSVRFPGTVDNISGVRRVGRVTILEIPELPQTLSP